MCSLSAPKSCILDLKDNAGNIICSYCPANTKTNNDSILQVLKHSPSCSIVCKRLEQQQLSTGMVAECFANKTVDSKPVWTQLCSGVGSLILEWNLIARSNGCRNMTPSTYRLVPFNLAFSMPFGLPPGLIFACKNGGRVTAQRKPACHCATRTGRDTVFPGHDPGIMVD